jgi:hypothetical protein
MFVMVVFSRTNPRATTVPTVMLAPGPFLAFQAPGGAPPEPEFRGQTGRLVAIASPPDPLGPV